MKGEGRLMLSRTLRRQTEVSKNISTGLMKIRELVGQIDDEGRRKADALKNFKKADRGVKEYIYRANEDQKNSERIKDLIDKLQHQVRNYKKQLEEAEDIASSNLAKYKVVQKSLMDAQE